MKINNKLWKPSEEQIRNANLTKFMNYINKNLKLNISTYDSLYKWSIENRADFWLELWNFSDVIHSKKHDTVLENPDDMLGSKWFSSARFNFAENLLRHRDDKPALIFQSENLNHKPEILTYNELYNQVAKLTKSLREAGVKTGDRVVGFMPNMNETIIAMLATVSIGAIWSASSPDFGLQGVLDRFTQIKPKILFTADGYFYNGKAMDSLSRVSKILEKIPSIEKVVVVPYVNSEPDVSQIPNSQLYKNFLLSEDNLEIKFEQLPFNHSIYILYSSGTTGVPKCIVHGAGGTLLQHLKELVLHTDLKREDNIFYFTTCGWMMWHWLVSSLAVGATLLLYDGSPFYPDAGRLFKFADEQQMTVFGTNARYLESVERLGLKPKEKFNLKNLRAILSTGSPLSVDSFEFVYRYIKEDLTLSSISGGTDIISCFALGNPIGSVWSGELQCIGLGMKCNVFDENGKPISGKKGELVCTASFPSQPVFFWNDEDKSKYKNAYFNIYPNVWRHGDYAELTQNNGMIIYGRSDVTLNPYGVRIGTAEIYQQVESMDEVLDSIAVGQNWNNTVRIILFVKLAADVELNYDLIKKIKTNIRDNCTPNHIPAKIIPIKDIPYTINGKKVEIAVKKTIDGEQILNKDALKNPEALELYKNLEELKI